jgi:acyl carrier protein
MNREEMIQTLATWIGEITEQAPPRLTAGTDLLKDLALDSLALAELGARVRMRFHVHIRPGELANTMQVGALVDLVQDKLRDISA